MKRLLFKITGQDDQPPENDPNENQPEQPQPESADDIRRRRMERFQQMEAAAQEEGLLKQQQQQQQQQTKSPTATSPKTSSPPLTSAKPAATPVTTTTTTTPAVSKPAPASKPAATTTSTSTTAANATKIRECSIPMTESDYYILERILFIYLRPTSESKAVFLQSLASELESEIKSSNSSVFKLGTDNLDRFIVERLSNTANYPSVEYLIATYNRLKNESKKKVRQFVYDQSLVNHLTELIVRYLGIILTIPDMFQNSSTSGYGTGPIQLVPYLKGEFTEEISFEFLQSFIDLYQDDKKDIFEPIFKFLSMKMVTITLLGDFLPIFKAFSTLIQFKPLSDILIQSQYWNPQQNNGAQMESGTLLGAYFSPSCVSNDRAVMNQYFPSASQLSQLNIRDAFVSIHSVLKNYHMGLHQLVRSLLKSSPEAKEAFLVWICSAIDKNSGRTKMNVEQETIASDGFTLNMVAVMILLCEAFVDVTFSKVTSVDTNYLLNSTRHDLTPYTRLSATSEEVAEWKNQNILNANSPTNFITECFFVALRCIHIAFNPAFNKIKNISRAMREVENLKRNLNETRSSWQNTPQARLHEANLEMTKKKEDFYKGLLFTLEAQLFEQSFIQKTAFFLIFTTKWLQNVINPKNQKLPLTEPNKQFSALPEFCIEDVVDFFATISNAFPQFLENLPLDILVNFFITVLSTPEYVKNPYLKAKIVEILSEFIPRGGNQPNSNYLASLFECNDLVKENLVPAIMRFYVDIEFTGAHNQFYEKFNYRYQAAHILKYLWKNPFFQNKIIAESKKPESFLRFTNMMINDSIYLLDESLAKLADIRNHQNLIETPEWEQLAADAKREKVETFHRNEDIVKSCLMLANNNVNMLHFLSQKVVEPFMRPEILDRISAMMNYFLSQLVGPKCTELKVREPEKYNFNPKVLLEQMTDIYLFLAVDERFVQSVVRDGRSFKIPTFVTADKIMRRERLKGDEQLDRFSKLIERLEQASKEEEQEEEDLGDIPDQYLDPILSTLMRDPVILPSSKTVIDRQTIVRHLLSDQTDPFNRSKLTEDMLVPNTELKAEIDAWIKSKKQK